MPADYHCEECNLFFSIGWFHYDGGQLEYPAASFLVCSECGTCHRIDHAEKPRAPATRWWCRPLFQRPDKAPLVELKQDRLFCQAAPLFAFLEKQSDQRINPVDLNAFREWKSLGEFPLRPWQYTQQTSSWAEGCNEPLELRQVACGHCEKMGTLLREEKAELPCPACKRSNVEIFRAWMT